MNDTDGHAPVTEKSITPNDFGPDTRDDFRVLKYDAHFAVFAPTGCMNGVGTGPSELHCKDGFFVKDTRILSRYILTLNRTNVTSLGAGVSDDTAVFSASLANSRLTDSAGREVRPYAIHIQRERFLKHALFDRLTFTNYSGGDVDLDVALDLWADFRDIFEVRGVQRHGRGKLGSPRFDNDTISFRYTTRDGLRVGTDVCFDRNPVNIGGRAHFRMRLGPGESDGLSCTIQPFREDGDASDVPQPMEDNHVREGALKALAARRKRLDIISSNRPRFDSWLGRSAADLAMLTSVHETGHYPYAGVPWFAAPFGRDAIIAALQTLWLDPWLAQGVLAYLAATQATESDPATGAAPGKILHEARDGEMARLGEVPFGRYYGGVDQTLLFIILAWETYQRTGDREHLQSLLPNVEAALKWAEDYGDCDGDGFVEYDWTNHRGLRNQGWKDSDDSVFNRDGRFTDGPIALVEVQAYYVAALRSAAQIFDLLERGDRSEALLGKADALEQALDAAFWDEEMQAWDMALDGEKRRVGMMSSNAGHVLYAKAARPERVAAFSKRMDEADILTHWGYRTVARGAALFNPMGYHTGSIWPHDNSMIAAGFARYGDKSRAGRIATALFHSSDEFIDQRLPELYCGFDTTDTPRLVTYPSACSPQAWAAGAPFLCLQACLGLEIDVPARRIHLVDPHLPDGLDHIEIRRLSVAGQRLDLRFVKRPEGRTHLEVLKAGGELNFTFDIHTAD